MHPLFDVNVVGQASIIVRPASIHPHELQFNIQEPLDLKNEN